MNPDMHRDHERPRTQDAAHGRVAVLVESADSRAGIHNLEGVLNF